MTERLLNISECNWLYKWDYEKWTPRLGGVLINAPRRSGKTHFLVRQSQLTPLPRGHGPVIYVKHGHHHIRQEYHVLYTRSFASIVGPRPFSPLSVAYIDELGYDLESERLVGALRDSGIPFLAVATCPFEPRWSTMGFYFDCIISPFSDGRNRNIVEHFDSELFLVE